MAMLPPVRSLGSRPGALLPLLLALPLHAQAPAPGPASDWGPFVGMSLSWVRLEPALQPVGPGGSTSTAAIVLYGGARWRQTWGFEVEQALYGDFKVNTGSGESDRDVCTTSLAALGWIPLGGSASAYAKAGVAYWTATQGDGYVFLFDTSDTTATGFTPHLGLGVEIAFGKGWIARLEGSLLPRVMSHRLTRVSAGAAVRF